MNLLIVDDELNIREGLKYCIDWSNYGMEEVITAGSGKDALEGFTRQHFDLVITDIKMPKMDGLELSREILKLYPNVKIILLTGYAEFEYARQAISIGVESYLLKPVDIEELTTLVERLCASLGQSNESHFLKQATAYIRSHYMKPITIGDIADALNKNASYFSHLFKKEAGISCIDYLTNVRIEKSKHLLATTNLLTYEISEKVGFTEYRYFSKQFKKSTGMSPTEYRNSHHYSF